jgi:hypothetical protein
MHIHALITEQKKLLRNLDGWLEKAAAHASAKKYDVNHLFQFRLSPDMLPLMFQIQAACDQAKYGAARTTGKEPPSHPDTEKTLEEARARISKIIAYLDTFKQSDFDGVEKRTVSLPRWEGKSMNAVEYFVEHQSPNFWFHVTMAYAILRHTGVELGKRDYLGPLPLK